MHTCGTTYRVQPEATVRIEGGRRIDTLLTQRLQHLQAPPKQTNKIESKTRGEAKGKAKPTKKDKTTQIHTLPPTLQRVSTSTPTAKRFSANGLSSKM